MFQMGGNDQYPAYDYHYQSYILCHQGYNVEWLAYKLAD